MTLFLKFVVFFAVYLIIQLLRPENALAWGPGVHTAIALGSLDAAYQLLPSIGRKEKSGPCPTAQITRSAEVCIQTAHAPASPS